ncbi:CesT family type III secretion system chaperone SpcU [Pseudomonas aeruginosa]|uniref:CesT family type III secretion system chaperone SpcU n=1 Tax=Pseudomonas aeruginosa TaxID=287 RepID=UPI00053D9641|nr:CesT family type III secretion system chaperone SpcU [Pseudomonas aeruginosa]MDP5788448.1 CesT family type III secretion system chaperone SpcU [Pseudomonas aeruginosa]MDP5972384.1 CesT family type III secretion system chaperone SpcU [Pseudomonas aeruginosa]HBO6811717.1 SpcU [Pseudomonas aeruginosa]
MIDTWLAQWGLRFPSSNDATLRLQPAEGPELVMERLEGGWLFAVELGLVPSGLPLGVILQLLQVNSPFSSLAPVKLAADDAGRLVLWAEARDGVDDVDALNRLHDRLREGHSRLVPLLESTGELVPAQIQTSALVFV